MTKNEKSKDLKKVGAKTKYTVDIGDRICAGISQGKSLSKIAGENDFCIASIFNWLRSNIEFLDNYTRAKEDQAELFAEEIIEIADTKLPRLMDGKIDSALVNQHRLRVDARKWVAAKLKPKKYGDLARVNLENTINLSDVDVPSRQDQKEWEGNEKEG